MINFRSFHEAANKTRRSTGRKNVPIRNASGTVSPPMANRRVNSHSGGTVTHSHGRFELATIPREEAPRTIWCSTLVRWQDVADDQPGDFGRWTRSIVRRIKEESLAEDCRIVMGD